jgi:hypothetical protein
MHAIVESENPTSLSVRRQAANISRTEWAMKKQLAIAAINIPVPVADKRLKLKMAFSA